MLFITASLYMKHDCLADSSLIRNWDIQVSANEEHKANIQPGSKEHKVLFFCQFCT